MQCGPHTRHVKRVASLVQLSTALSFQYQSTHARFVRLACVYTNVAGRRSQLTKPTRISRHHIEMTS